MAQVFQSGANYEIVLLEQVVSCRVWQRPDLSREEGARCAEEKIGVLSSLARHRLWGLLFDMSEAPPAWGPITHAALTQIVSAWEAVGAPVVVVVGPDAIQKLSVRRLISEACPTVGRIVSDRQSGLALAARRGGQKLPSRR